MESISDGQEVITEVVKKNEICGSFFLDDTEIVVDVDYIQEVVNFPDNVVRQPLAPDFLLGMFNLRGRIIPIINLKKLLNFQDSTIDPKHKVAILEINRVQVGFVFDSTGSIIRLTGQESCDFNYTTESEHKVIKGALKLENGSRIIQILDPQALVSIKNIPQVSSTRGDRLTNESQNRLKVTRKRCITFRVGPVRMAIEITGIHEVLESSNIQQSPLAGKLCIGVITLRGVVVPIMRFSRILKIDETAEEAKAENKRIIILKLEQEYFGFLVDSIESINTYLVDAVMPIPLLSEERSKMFQGCLSLQGVGEVILLDHKHILHIEEVLNVTQGHSKIYQSESADLVKKELANNQRETYISFKLNHLFGVLISEVKEIINYSENVLAAPCMPNFVLGLLNLRGHLVTIVDTRKLYGLGASSIAPQELKIVIFQSGTDQFGLLVDSIESILHTSSQTKLKLPDLFSSKIEGSLRQDVSEVVEIAGTGDGKISLMVLNISSMVNRIKLQMTSS